jgi:flagellar operon protein
MVTMPINPGTPPPAPAATQTARISSTSTRQEINPGLFQRELDSRIRPEGLTFSRHAQKRLEMRGIQFTPQGLERINQAVDRAAEKGSRDTAVVAGDLALVVNVAKRTVVTVMNRDAMQDSIVTNIDSAVFA